MAAPIEERDIGMNYGELRDRLVRIETLVTELKERYDKQDERLSSLESSRDKAHGAYWLLGTLVVVMEFGFKFWNYLVKK